MTSLKPFYEDVQAHYDLSNEFFDLFLDPTHTYSCAYFEDESMTLEEAQIAKIDLALGKCDLKPGMTLLDVGCGWGATIKRAREKYDVNVIGLTLSRNQYERVNEELQTTSSLRTAEVRLQGWEEFDGTVDRIVSIGAFEHFQQSRYDAFFSKCFEILPPDGRMLLHTIVGLVWEKRKEGYKVKREDIQFARFIMTEIFPGGELPLPAWVPDHATRAGFGVERVQPLQLHYARTLDYWAEALEAHHDEAVAIASTEEYERYMKYLTGCAERFRSGLIDVRQYTLVK